MCSGWENLKKEAWVGEDYEYGAGSGGGDEEGHRIGYLKSCHMEEEERNKNDGLMVHAGNF